MKGGRNIEAKGGASHPGVQEPLTSCEQRVVLAWFSPVTSYNVAHSCHHYKSSDFIRVCVCVVMVPVVLEMGDTTSPRAGVSGGCELPTWVLESELDPVEEQPAFFPVEPALQPPSVLTSPKSLTEVQAEPWRREGVRANSLCRYA